jgi:23S rRNA pseudouridine2605 synthase
VRKGIGKGQGAQGRRVQLHRALSKLGLGSRTQAWDWIRAGEVRVDGRVVTDPLTWVDLDCQQITHQGLAPAARADLTIALHKPPGVVTTHRDERGRRTVYDLLSEDLPWIFPVGRLDADSEGLLILTSDSALATRLTEPEHRIPKTYQVTVNGRLGPEALDLLRQGVELADGRTRPAGVKVLEQTDRTTTLEIVLTEGRNRQIRRMAAAVGHRVRRLIRVAIGAYALGDLPAGQYRTLDEEDLGRLGRCAPRPASDTGPQTDPPATRDG